MIDLAIWGASGHARVVIDAVRCSDTYRAAVLIDDRVRGQRPDQFEGLDIIGGREMIASLASRGIHHIIVAFGNCAARTDASQSALEAGLGLATVIHPSAVVAADVRIGEGSFVAAGVVINSGTVIGRAAIINTRSSIDHDCTIGAGTHVCPGVTIAGNVVIGAGSWIGVGSIVGNGVAVGSGTLIGAGALVLSSIPDDVVAFGAPASVVRAVTSGDGLVR